MASLETTQVTVAPHCPRLVELVEAWCGARLDLDRLDHPGARSLHRLRSWLRGGLQPARSSTSGAALGRDRHRVEHPAPELLVADDQDVQVVGDQELGRRVLDAMAITP